MSIFNKHSTPTFSENIKRYRKEAGLSQEELASRIGLTAQAISKWECGLSYPDVTLLLPLAELFGITADEMLKGLGSATPVEKEADVEEEQIKTISAGEAKQTESLTADGLENNDILKDDGVLRVVQCLGRRILRIHELNPDDVIHLPDVEASEIHIFGNASIRGDVEGNVHTNGSLNCQDVEGNAFSNGSLNCVNVEGDARASGSLNCDNIEGNAAAGGNLTASCIKGDAKAGGKLIIINN